MKLFRQSVAILVLVSAILATAQTQVSADPCKPVLDRLQAITTMPLEHWGFDPVDRPHGEVPPQGMPAKPVLGIGSEFRLPMWLYASVQVPPQLNGYNLNGARLTLDANIDSNQEINVSVFSNGNMIARTDGEGQVPITLTAHAQSGQSFQFAVRVLASGGVGCCGG